MSRINQMIEAAEAAGFVRTECVHPYRGGNPHIVLDYPKPLVEGQITPVWRIHTDTNKVPHATYIAGPRNGQHRVSLVAAIEWARKVASENPKS